ncbi:hypothetical protein ACO1KE_18560 [Leptospira interrogans serovar Bataviae]|nr:hypothetical protein [Leptospira interrogans serovar Bataviae]OAM86121.1 hypothetical protein A1343_15935 [Leptospira interrogans serovar Bataviae]QOI40701.1 hypothetical protein Lepto1548_19735 [Leptospira interrogans serovar Bataviae]
MGSCSIQPSNLNADLKICLNIDRLNCSGSFFVDSQEKIQKLISGMNNLIRTIDNCIIDADNEKNYLIGLQLGENIHFKKKNIIFNQVIPATSSIDFCYQTSTLNQQASLISQQEYYSLYDPNIYLAVYAQSRFCLDSIPLTMAERLLVNQLRNSEKSIFSFQK